MLFQAKIVVKGWVGRQSCGVLLFRLGFGGKLLKLVEHLLLEVKHQERQELGFDVETNGLGHTREDCLVDLIGSLGFQLVHDFDS